MQDTRYTLTPRAEALLNLLDRLLGMSQEHRTDLAHHLHCASEILMSADDDMTGATCLLEALELLTAVNVNMQVNANVN
jgi:hypothetical protein